MNHKKNMRIFWLSLSLLLAAGVIIIITVQFRSHKKTETEQVSLPPQNATVQDAEDTKADTDKTLNQYNNTAFNSEQTDRRRDRSLQQTTGEAVNYLYELKVSNGYLEVYYYQTERLFLHTGIPYHTLTNDQKQNLQTGKYFKDAQELYGYLESCTS